MKRTRTWRRCSCGKRLEVPPDQVETYGGVCPACGKSTASEIDLVTDQDVSGVETERVGFYEMAQLAQDDIELTDVEEWDTSEEQPEEDITEEM